MTTKVLSPTPVELLKAKTNPDVVDVPARCVIALDGTGSPADPVFTAAVGALYGLAYTIRFSRKGAGRPVFKVGALEGEWRAEGVDLAALGVPDPDTWLWRVQICMPPDLTEAELADAIEAATTKRKGKLEGSIVARDIRLVRLEPARFARVLHVGPYATEPESFARMGDLLTAMGLEREPWHMEIYLSDPSRTAPEKLKTALLAKIRS